jgi:DNA-binding winged helix-turn-helix (wHTH) protein
VEPKREPGGESYRCPRGVWLIAGIKAGGKRIAGINSPPHAGALCGIPGGFTDTPTRKREQRIRLQEKPCDLLLALLEHPGEIITREALREKLWPANTFVDFDHGLNNAVNRLRKALFDSADKPQFIETVPRRGDRFIGSIKADSPPLPEPVASPANSVPAPAAMPTPVKEMRRKRLLFFFSVAVLAVTLLTWQIVRRPAKAAPIESIAVLPLANLAADGTEEYFADGMTGEVDHPTRKSGIATRDLPHVGHALPENESVLGRDRCRAESRCLGPRYGPAIRRARPHHGPTGPHLS